ncbi:MULTISPECIES: glycosyltransferase [Klebsiella pneumoniae complex]|uniref:glycosyltransferase n=1 Tax=Klebsiella pneumoniae complex TaxID=3390273 RepID=UPI0013DDA845|nr:MULTISPECIES: glycosyltransferase [Klebsiella]HBW1581920.1 glycosyltransferase [Klebsiella quasipneumoniae subsp. quasipneumoniae]MCC4981394.1 glycosyltransferase [Klebsiella pneumoniae]MCR8555233.1 glycosyltransferase [Klebsiella quasipneumoniae]HBW1726155.1 glycosyltransferase [Klebsiella quasipneumoniae subsp. quasipneumoniae]HBW1818178.1 glycosyltransferase [Klebsiella quasipneumoniae subsp. quasipneumoniae]
MTEELVTVYIPTHNRNVLVERAIKSVLAQTYKNLEIIICDDGSSDSTWEVLTRLKKNDERIKLLRNTIPKGACVSRNNCIRIAKGKYITGLDDDDEFLPERIEKFIGFINNNTYQLVCSNLFYKSDGFMSKGERYSGVISKKMIGYRNMIGNQIFSETCLIKDIGGFDEKAPAWQDYDLWFRLLSRGYECYRIDDATYIMDIAHDAPRITTSSKAYLGYQYFVTKHRDVLSNFQLNSLYLEDKTNRGEYVSFVDVITNPCKHGCQEYLKNKVKKYFPVIKRIVDEKKKVKL